MSYRFVLRFDGPLIEGDSTLDGHEKTIDVIGWRFGFLREIVVSRERRKLESHRLAAGGAQLAPLIVTKQIDLATPALIEQAGLGTHFDKITLLGLEMAADGGKPLDVIRVTMWDVLIAEVAPGAEEEKGVVSAKETLVLRSMNVTVTFTPKDETGVPGKPVISGWDLAKDRPAR